MENKNSYFRIQVKLGSEKFGELNTERIENGMDIVLSSLGANSELYKYYTDINEEERIYQYLFRTKTRKR